MQAQAVTAKTAAVFPRCSTESKLGYPCSGLPAEAGKVRRYGTRNPPLRPDTKQAHMKQLIVLLAALIAMSTGAAANPQVDALGKCVAENSSGKDRKDLARWLFVAMSAHPEMKAISSVSANVTDDVSRTAGTLFTRLLADACATQARAAIQVAGSTAIQSAFSVLGQLAMQELMTDKDVAATMGVLERYLDRQKLEALNR